MSDANAIPLQYQVCIYQQQSGSGWGTSLSDWTSNGVLTFSGWLSQNFSYEQGAEYDTPFKNVFGNNWVMTTARAMGMSAMSPVMTAQLWTGSAIPEFQLELDLEAETDPISEIRTPVINLLKMVTPTVDGSGMLMSPGPSIDPKQILEAMKSSDNSLLASTAGAISSALDTVSSTFNGTTNSAAVSANTSGNRKSGTTSGTSNSVPADQGSGNPLTSSFWITNKAAGLSNQVSVTIGTYLYFPSVVITNVGVEFLHLLDSQNGWPMSARVNVSFKPLFAPTVEDFDNMFKTTSATASSMA